MSDVKAVFDRIAELPPGPERRALMREIGMNTTPADFSEAERQARANRSHAGV